MDKRNKLDSHYTAPVCQDNQQHFRNAYLTVSGAMLLCELLLLAVLLWRRPSLTQMQVYGFLLLSGAVLIPLFLGILADSARTRSLVHKKRENPQHVPSCRLHTK